MSISERVEIAQGADWPAEHVEGRPFMTWERASFRSVSDTTSALLIDDPAIQGERAINCLCGCASIFDHNGQASRIVRTLHAFGYDYERKQ